MPSAREQVTVRTREGVVVGGTEEDGTRVWRGIRYAAAPTGPARFLPPTAAPSWEGERVATRFSPICPQPGLGGIPPREPMESDCLNVNIWSPPDADGLPVLVWIHGGGYLYGSGSSPLTNGRALARSGAAVVVTLNYRLGYQGFLDLSTVPGAEGRFETNLGLRDQIAALSWVKENIRGFGGDPDRVTIFGQSAGGASVCCLVASPLARGLFGAAIAQSPPAASVFDRGRAAYVTERFLAALGRPDSTLDELLEVDEAALLDASGRVLDELIDVFPGHHAFQPVVDGDVLLDTPVRSIAAGHGSSVPLLVGSNQDEGSLFARPPMPPLIPTSTAGVGQFLDQDHPDAAARVIAAYTADDGSLDGVALGGDGMVAIPALAVAEAASRRAAAYVYRFGWTNHALVAMGIGTPHTLDVPFVFGTLSAFPLTDLTAEGGDAAAVSAAIQRAWLGFARDREPDADGIGWPPYDREHRSVLMIGSELTIADDPDGARRTAWIVPYAGR